MAADRGQSWFMCSHLSRITNLNAPPETRVSANVTVPRLFADLGAERVKEQNDLSSPSKRESIHFPEYFLATGHRFANTRSPHRVVSTRATMRGEMWSARRLLFSSPSSSGLDKKRSHFPLKINKTAAQSEHAHNSKLGMWRGYSPSPPPELLSRRKTLFFVSQVLKILIFTKQARVKAQKTTLFFRLLSWNRAMKQF